MARGARITGKQRTARIKNIKIARESKKRGSKKKWSMKDAKIGQKKSKDAYLKAEKLKRDARNERRRKK